MYKVAILEDDEIFLKHLASKINSYFTLNKIKTTIVEYKNGTALAASLPSNIDLYFLDVGLPDISGIDIADVIRQQNTLCSIVFVSSMDETVFDAIKYRPLRFIRKERLDEELEDACNAFLMLNQHRSNQHNILIRQKNETIPINPDDIIYIETSGHYLDFHCRMNDYHIRGSFSDFGPLTASAKFGRAGQSFLVNFDYIVSLKSTEIFLKDGTKITLTRSKKEEFQNKYMRYQRVKIYEHHI